MRGKDFSHFKQSYRELFNTSDIMRFLSYCTDFKLSLIIIMLATTKSLIIRMKQSFQLKGHLVIPMQSILHLITWLFNNYSPKWRWIVVDIYWAAKRRGKYPLMFTDTEVNNNNYYCFSIYHTSWQYTAKISIKGCMNSGKRFFIVKCSVLPSCQQIKLLQAIVKLLQCHFLNGWVKFLLLLKPSSKTSDVSLFSLWWF